jgi:hypothetical protein
VYEMREVSHIPWNWGEQTRNMLARRPWTFHRWWKCCVTSKPHSAPVKAMAQAPSVRKGLGPKQGVRRPASPCPKIFSIRSRPHPDVGHPVFPGDCCLVSLRGSRARGHGCSRLPATCPVSTKLFFSCPRHCVFGDEPRGAPSRAHGSCTGERATSPQDSCRPLSLSLSSTSEP